jgi:hypothetical protein
MSIQRWMFIVRWRGHYDMTTSKHNVVQCVSVRLVTSVNKSFSNVRQYGLECSRLRFSWTSLPSLKLNKRFFLFLYKKSCLHNNKLFIASAKGLHRISFVSQLPWGWEQRRLSKRWRKIWFIHHLATWRRETFTLYINSFYSYNNTAAFNIVVRLATGLLAICRFSIQ